MLSPSPPCAQQARTPRSLNTPTLMGGRRSTLRHSPYQRRQATGSPAASRRLGFDPDDRQENLSPLNQAAILDERHPGRKLGPIWRHFTKLSQRTHAPVECRGCGTRLGSGIPRRTMVPHVLACAEIPVVEKDFIRRKYGIEVPVSSVETTTVGVIRSDSDAGNTTRESPVTQEEFELMVARLWCMCALPFLLVESLVLRKFFFTLVPHLNLPSRAKLSNVLLPKVRDEVEAKVIESIGRQRTVSVTADVCNDQKRINILVTAPWMKSLLWSSLHIRNIQHTAGKLMNELERVVKEIQTKTKATVVAVLSNNAPKMVDALELLENKLPVFGGCCAAQMLNLAMDDVFKTITFISDVKDQACTIVRFFQDHHDLLDEFRKLQKSLIPSNQHRPDLSISVPTRCYSTCMHSCLKSVLTNRPVLKGLFCNPCYKPLLDGYSTTEIELTVGSEDFWDRLIYAVALIDPIIEALCDLESDDAQLSRVYSRFRWLLEGYSTQPLSITPPGDLRRPHRIFGELLPDQMDRTQRHAIASGVRTAVCEQFRAIIEKRWSMCHTSAMRIAFFLDPHTDMSKFVGDDVEASIIQACDLQRNRKYWSF